MNGQLFYYEVITLIKLLWIPIVLYVLAIIGYIAFSPDRDTDSSFMLRVLAGQGIALPVLFFAILFIWFFSRRKKRREQAQ